MASHREPRPPEPRGASRQVLLMGASVRAMAQSAVRAGFEPVGFDLFADRDLLELAPRSRAAEYPNGIARAVLAEAPSVVAYTGGFENSPSILREVAERHQIWGVLGPNLQRARDPEALVRLADEACGLFRVPRVARRAETSGRWLRKRRDSSGGRGVRYATHEEAGREPDDGHYFQEFIEGTPASGAALRSHGKSALLDCSRQWIGDARFGAKAFQYAGNAHDEAVDALRPRLAAMAEQIGARFDLTGLFGFDVIVSGEVIWLVEVNPRWTASMELTERVTSARLFALHAGCFSKARELATGLDAAAMPARVGAACKCVLYALEGEGWTAAALEDLWRERREEADAPPWLADVPTEPVRLEPGSPVCTVFGEGATPARAQAQLMDRVARVRRALRA